MPTLHRLTSLPPLPDRIWQATVHPTLPILALACADKAVHLFSLTTFAPLSTIDGGHKRSVRSVAFKPSTPSAPEIVLATGSFDATAGIWRHDNVNAENSWDGPVKAEGEDDEEEEEDWRFAVVLEGHENEIKGVAWNAGGDKIATCSRDKSVWVWEEMEEDNFETVAVLQEHSADVKAVCWHPEEDLLASASYDDTVRLYREDFDDWTCISILSGHTSTVWSIDFEKPHPSTLHDHSHSGPCTHTHESTTSRLVSASDDTTLRVWHRTSLPATKASRGLTPSIIRGQVLEEEWETQSVLPQVHTRAVYGVSWSGRSGRIASCGGDGKVVVYEEREVEGDVQESTDKPAEAAAEGAEETKEDEKKKVPAKKTEWVVIAELEGAHGVHEINSVTWSRRWDKDGKEGDEILLSAGDDGVVNVYTIE
ncbi:WD40 repeat-like protein [Ascobolus immersus RN42]|uniref:Probable cytosolic iron-sulfur protein assembly protein 1 n=1 Tax=Ascobolus immersus RN42 TaxID=1160509 RepID=A0A3N4ICX7_ASCIM|nr:WD40 repeat-like protein [Ascobolus immersus RN42]